VYYTVRDKKTPDSWEHLRNVENANLRHVPVMFYHSHCVRQGLGFFICEIM